MLVRCQGLEVTVIVEEQLIGIPWLGGEDLQ